MGGAFAALADEPSAVMWNPAGLAQVRQTEIATAHDFLYTRLGEDKLGRTYIGCISPVMESGAFGLNLIRLQSILYTESTIAVSYSQRLGPLYFGLSAKGLFASFAENEYTRIDPLFQAKGLLTKGFSIDLGLLLNVRDVLSLGVSAQNINQPNMALGEEESVLPLELNAGIALKSLKVNSCFDFTFRNDKIMGKRDINLRFGLETWPLNDVGLRAGVNLYELAAGASYRFKSQEVELQLDYAFRYPMPSRFVQAPITNTMGSHQFSLSLRFENLLRLMGVVRKSRKLDPALRKALSYQEAEDYKAAIAIYRRVLQQNDTNQEAHFLLANLYTKLKRYEEAIVHYKRAIELAPDEPRFHYALGRLYEQYGDDTGDEKWYNKAFIEFAKTRMLDINYKDVSYRLEKIRSQKRRF